MKCQICEKETPMFAQFKEGSSFPCCANCYALNVDLEKVRPATSDNLLSFIIEKCEALKYSVTTSSELLSPVAEVEEICELLYKLEKELE